MILHSSEQIARYRSEGFWGSITLDDLLRRNAAAVPGRLALADAPNRGSFAFGSPRRLCYGELQHEVDDMAAALLDAGVCKGDVVVVQMPNIVELIVLYLACARIGAISSPLAVQSGAHEMTQTLDALGEVSAVVAIERFKGQHPAATWAQVLTGRTAPPRLLVVGAETGGGFQPWPARADPQQAAARVERYRSAHDFDADEILTVCWTSGTSGTPKGVPRSHNNWLLHARVVIDACGVQEGEKMINPFSAVNLSGIAISLIVGQLAAGSVHLHHPFDRDVFLAQIVQERIAFAVAAPAVLTMLLKDDELLAHHPLDSLRCVMSGSAGLSGWMIGEYRRRFHIDIVNGFGSNEGVTLVSTATDIPDPALRAEYFPRPDPRGGPGVRLCRRAMEAKLVDPDSGEEIHETGVSGELAIRGGGIFPGYFRRPDLTAASFDRDGFFLTGDLFQIAADEQGRPTLLRCVGRLKSVINRGGMKISPEELAALMEQHPSVAEADVIGYPDEVLGERICACIALRPGTTLTLAELNIFLTGKDIARYKLPERLQIFERLPRNVTGKVVRPALQQAVLAAQPARS